MKANELTAIRIVKNRVQFLHDWNTGLNIDAEKELRQIEKLLQNILDSKPHYLANNL